MKPMIDEHMISSGIFTLIMDDEASGTFDVGPKKGEPFSIALPFGDCFEIKLRDIFVFDETEQQIIIKNKEMAYEVSMKGEDCDDD